METADALVPDCIKDRDKKMVITIPEDFIVQSSL